VIKTGQCDIQEKGERTRPDRPITRKAPSSSQVVDIAEGERGKSRLDEIRMSNCDGGRMRMRTTWGTRAFCARRAADLDSKYRRRGKGDFKEISSK